MADAVSLLLHRIIFPSSTAEDLWAARSIDAASVVLRGMLAFKLHINFADRPLHKLPVTP